MEVQYRPPTIRFDPRISDQIELLALPRDFGQSDREPSGGRNPFNGYERTLTDGGIRIVYSDLNRGLPVRVLRFVLCALVGGSGAWHVLVVWPLDELQMIGGLGAVALAVWGLWKFKIKSRHILEIRPDALVVDDRYVFYQKDMGRHRPELRPKGEAGRTEMFVGGICGTRFIEYATANRIDENDHTPEVLEADLKEAFEQLWDRREVTFPAIA